LFAIRSLLFFFYLYAALRDLHSFPTRRSSDLMPEFSKSALEVLRQPLEDREVTISRARAVFTYPAEFMLVGSMNPCPCGFFGWEEDRTCTCTPRQVHRYRSRISGPLLDRIDIH